MKLAFNWNGIKCLLVAGTVANQVPTFPITHTKLYVPVITLSNQDNVKLFKQLKSGFKRTINWNKYKSIAKQIFRFFNWNDSMQHFKCKNWFAI